jgi:glycosyltransferase involved in cell wall biosynthesis
MHISVILCTYNPNESYLSRSLDAILNQDLNQEDWELLVVDNNSTIPVKDRYFVQQRRVRIEFEGRQGLSAARECGIKYTRGEILVFVDDDNILAPDYLRKVKDVFETPNIGIVSGEITPEYEREPADWFKEWEGILAIRRPLGEKTYFTNIPLFNEHFPIGAGMAVRRDVIEDYYEAIANGSAYISGRKGTDLSSAEDIDLDFFAISQGFLIGTVGALKMKHIIPAGRTTIDYISRLAIASTKSAGEVNKKWRETFGTNVFSFLSISPKEVRLRCIITYFLCWIPKYKIRHVFFKTVKDLVN